MPASFVDTNVLIYLVSADERKAQQAEALLAGGVRISVQVLNEMAHVARRKARMSWAEVRGLLSAVRVKAVVDPVTYETHETGLDLAERYGLSVFDAQIAASALHAGCTVLWSEDMQHGMVLGGRLAVLNPFKDAVD